VGTAYDNDMLNLANVSQVMITGNTLSGYGSGHTAVRVNVGSDIVISGNVFTGGENHIYTDGTSVSNLNITGNDFRAFTTYLWYNHASALTGSSFTNNVINGSYAASIGLYTRISEGLLIEGNQFGGTSAITTYIDASGSTTFNPVIRNNIFDSTKATNMIVYYSIAQTSNSQYGYTQHTEHFQDVLAADTDYIVAAEDLSAAAPITFTIDAQPDVPRTITWVLTHTNITAFTLVINGIDAKGQNKRETFTAASGWSGETSNAFATIASISLSTRTGTGAGDTCNIGIGSKLGLSNIITATTDVIQMKRNNAAITIGTTSAVYGTVDATTIGAADDITILYRQNLNVIK